MSLMASKGIRFASGRIVALALFVLGSNYCTLSAWTGRTPMACMVVPTAASAAPMHHCPHHRTPSDRAPLGAPVGGSCCPAPAVAPSAPTVAKDLAVATPLFAMALALVTAPAMTHGSVGRGRPPTADDSPPPSASRAPLPARAPPLA